MSVRLQGASHENPKSNKEVLVLYFFFFRTHDETVMPWNATLMPMLIFPLSVLLIPSPTIPQV